MEEPQFLYLDTLGWKTGRRHRIEIWFVEHGGKYYAMSEGGARAHWVQNIIHCSKVSFNVGSKNFEGTGKVIADHDPSALKIKKLMKSKYGWDSGLIVELMPG